MDAEWKKRTQITLIILMVLALARVGFIFYERSQEGVVRKPPEAPPSSYKITLDDYVTPRKIFPYDLKSAREIVGKPVWVRTGNQLMCFPYSTATRSVELAHPAGLLAPLEKLEVKDVVAENVRGQKQVMVVFSRKEQGAEYAVTVGKVNAGTYDFFINDVLFFEDPHQLYNHWPSDVWDAIDQHQVTPGMNELQASFALGSNMRVTAGDYGNRTVQYIVGDKSTMVSFSENKAVTVEAGPHP